MGAIMTQRPDLYAAVNIGVPLFDMLRYHKLLAGASWIGEYGNPDIPEERAYIEKYSPYQQLSEGKDYPTPFFYTSTKDDRVHPGSSSATTFCTTKTLKAGTAAPQTRNSWRTALPWSLRISPKC